ncbi:unnamed protein product [Pocillopora meandrina]|uniref:Uncharacterized protein n=1 Tax=Pocillopora meandrina TaxID=46732 RepID=A0AAU9WL30_9CNID|nr:unnamed protein product [Pocillopora meandrina]
MTVSELVMAISGHRNQVRLRNYIGRTAREGHISLTALSSRAILMFRLKSVKFDLPNAQKRVCSSPRELRRVCKIGKLQLHSSFY